MAGIFISYRRADSDGWAGRLRDALRAQFGGDVFRDVDSIPDGEIFSEVIDRALQECDVALVIIGPNWATARDKDGRRLDQEEDWVRTETAMVLNRKIRVIPVLVGGASLPRAEELPEELRSLTKRQAREIRSNSWDSDVGLLVAQLKQIVGDRRKRPIWLYALPALVVVVGLGVFAGRWFGPSPLPPTPVEHTTASGTGAPAPRAEPTREASTIADASKNSTSDALKDKPPDIAPPTETKPRPVPPREATASSATPEPRNSAPLPSRSSSERPPAPERTPSTIAKSEPQSSRGTSAAPAPEARRPTRPQPDAERPSNVIAAPAPVAPRVAPERIASAASVDLPNRPASSRELKIGDSWTYRLREMRFNQDLATVTHEVSGGDTGGIRETVRIGQGVAGEAEAGGGSSQAATRRRLPLEPRIFEQQINRSATLFEFAPFITQYSELVPGVTWTRIAGARSSDSVNEWRFNGKVTGRERIGVPAGNFLAIKAELEGQLNLSSPMTRDVSSETVAAYQTYSIWFVPALGRAVKYERRTYNRVRRPLDHEQYELVSYQLK